MTTVTVHDEGETGAARLAGPGGRWPMPAVFYGPPGAGRRRRLPGPGRAGRPAHAPAARAPAAVPGTTSATTAAARWPRRAPPAGLPLRYNTIF